jgi:protein phosphatase
MNEADSGHSEQQNILLRVVGREPEIEVDVTEVAVQSGDYLLLCSDGLTRMVPESAVGCAIVDLRHPQRICDYLIAVANRNGGADNVTVVVVEILDSWWRHVTDGWRRYVWSAARWQA